MGTSSCVTISLGSVTLHLTAGQGGPAHDVTTTYDVPSHVVTTDDVTVDYFTIRDITVEISS
jgi:hypothetical protein